MLEQLSNSVTFYAFFVASKQGKTGLTVTVDVWEYTKAGVKTEVVTGASATEIGDGLYAYILSSGNVDAEGEYIAVFKTTDSTVDHQHIPAIWVVQRAGIENLAALTMTDAFANKIADHIIRRSFQNACDSSDGDTKVFRSLLGAIAKLVNRVGPSGSTLNIYEDDDTTILGTQTITTDADADPITELNTT